MLFVWLIRRLKSVWKRAVKRLADTLSSLAGLQAAVEKRLFVLNWTAFLAAPLPEKIVGS